MDACGLRLAGAAVGANQEPQALPHRALGCSDRRRDALAACVACVQIDKLFRLQHTDPWVNSDKHRTSRTIEIMNNRSSGAWVGSPPTHPPTNPPTQRRRLPWQLTRRRCGMDGGE